MQNSLKTKNQTKIQAMKRIGSFLAAFLILQPALAVEFTATVDKNELAPDETLVLSLTVRSEGSLQIEDQPRLPDMKGFEVLGSWNASKMNSSYINGKFQTIQEMVYNYTLAPAGKGKFTIGPAQLTYQGQTLTTKPILITVSDQPSNRRAQPRAAPSEPDDDFMGDEDQMLKEFLKRRGFDLGDGGIRTQPKNDREAFFITVDVSKRRAYVGEQIGVKYYLYTRAGISDYQVLKYPELKGFWKEDLEIATRLNFQSEIVNGVSYQKALLVSYAAFPISAGQKQVDEYKAKASIVEAGSMFGFGRNYTFTKSSEKVPIEVLPLPTEGQPKSFSGAVGTFTIAGSLDKSEVKANQPVSLKIRIQGEGNVKSIELPNWQLPPNVELFDTKKDAKFQPNGQSYREFELILIPRSAGDLTIPSVELSYFDPSKKSYQTLKTPDFPLKVLPGQGGSTGPNAPLAVPDQEKTKSDDIRFIKTEPLGAPLISRLGPILPLAFVLVWLGFGISLFASSRVGSRDSKSLIMKMAKAKLKVARAKAKKGDFKGVGVECSNALLQSLGEASGLGVGMTADEMLSRLPGTNESLAKEINSLLSKFEFLSFAPDQMKAGSAVQNPSALVDEAEKLISKILSLKRS